MMPIVQAVIAAAITCSSLACPYHNSEFGYSVKFPKVEQGSVCVPDGPGGRHGARLMFRKDGDCEKLDVPSVGVSADYNALHWKDSISAAEALCLNGTVKASNLKLDGLPVAECNRKSRFVRGWTSVSFIAVNAPKNDDGLIFTVGLTAPTAAIVGYLPTAKKLLNAVVLDATR